MQDIDIEASKQPEMIAISTVMLTLSTLAVVLRCWSAAISSDRQVGLDDCFAVITLVSVS